MAKPETKTVQKRHIDEVLTVASLSAVELHDCITRLNDKLDPVLREPGDREQPIVEAIDDPCEVEIAIAKLTEAILSAAIRIRRITERART